MKKAFMASVVVVILLAFCLVLPCSVSAETYTNVSISGTCDYPEAMKVLQLVNQERAYYGLTPLTLDYSLTELAMFRAAECAIYYPTDSNHTRPNGQPCNTAPGFPKYNWSENVAAGYASAAAVMNGWMNSSGHRTNILKSTRNSIGIGVFKHGGTYYWAQVFSGEYGNATSYSVAENRSFVVQVANSFLKIGSSSIDLMESQSKPIPMGGRNQGYSSFSFSLNRDCFNYSTGNPSVATVDNQGEVTAVGKGQTQIYLQPKNGGTTLTVSVNVRSIPRITKDISSVCVRNGQVASVTVNATGEGLYYFWYKKDTTDDYFVRVNTISGNQYTATMSNSVAGRQVYCIVADQCGYSVVSRTATLYQPVRITKQPLNGCAYSGKKATVTVKATGAGLTYRWYVKNPGSSKYVYTSSFKGNTYSVTMNKERAGRRVMCRIYDKFGNVVQSNSVVLDYKVKITKQPQNVCKKNGKTAKVTVKASGVGLKYYWYVKYPGNSKYEYTSSFKGNTYSITMNDARAGRKVYCIVVDKYRNYVQSASVSLDKPVSVIKAPKNAVVTIGDKATVTVKAKGGGLTYRWYVKYPGSNKYAYTSSFKGNTYSVSMNNSRAGRRVFCKIYDRYGNSVQTKSVVLDQKVYITQEPVWVATASYGKKATATVKAKGNGLTYRWYYKHPWDKTYSYTSSFKSNTYSIKMDTSKIGRQVYCVVTDKYGNKVKSRTTYFTMP